MAVHGSLLRHPPHSPLRLFVLSPEPRAGSLLRFDVEAEPGLPQKPVVEGAEGGRVDVVLDLARRERIEDVVDADAHPGVATP